MEELKKKFPRLLDDEYASWDHEDKNFSKIGDFTPAFDFNNFIEPVSINIQKDKKDNVAYISNGHFLYLWDPEHGFKVITHKNRAIDLSPEADVFKINKDNGTYEQLENELYNKEWKLPMKKKWWEFWQ